MRYVFCIARQDLEDFVGDPVTIKNFYKKILIDINTENCKQTLNEVKSNIEKVK